MHSSLQREGDENPADLAAGGTMNVIDAILARTSARKLEGPGPSADEIDLILACGMSAPDHGRLQPWRFVVIAGAGRERLGVALAADRRRRSPDASETALRAERDKALRAPTIIAAAARPQPGRIPLVEQRSAVAAGVQNMFLAAIGLGYGAMWKTGDAAYSPDVKTAIGLEATDELVAFLYLGRATASGEVRPRLSRERVSFCTDANP